MPRLDGTGPMGTGRMQGRQMGNCEGAQPVQAGYGMGRGAGMGRGVGMGRGAGRMGAGLGNRMGWRCMGRGAGRMRGCFAPFVPMENEKDVLTQHKQNLQARLEAIDKRLETL
ncbi:MAG: DUF5320 domain-containing protein [Christensenellales bacterium]|jgi:hypothetical protein